MHSNYRTDSESPQRGEGRAAPHPPPPPPPSSLVPAAATTPISASTPKPHLLFPPTGHAGAFILELVVHNSSPFKDHWAYWVSAKKNHCLGLLLHATGDVRNGFKFEIKRNYDFRATFTIPMERIEFNGLIPNSLTRRQCSTEKIKDLCVASSSAQTR
ncbi:hypothetical protein J3459_016541 [Metarhizium acridum]|uniref:uncharacterized protein n=1 Tax=Metarhizium acridum TaxID=92637 RepID=UPI001C6CFBF3|nr:hypothetical protein J3459_016541 [Metarhizium acridum]KAG8411519.1 hypothetical protein J3458_015575 [Metarhizium acridum]